MFRPRFFLSYSGADRLLAEKLKHILDPFAVVFFAGDDMLAGEDFVARLRGELDRCDALVALITSDSAQSPWCQAEWYHALARAIQVIPVRDSASPAVLPQPLRLLQERTHFFDLASSAKLPDALAVDIRRARRARAKKRILTGLVAALIVASVITAGAVFVRQSATIEHWRDRRTMLSDIERVAQPFPALMVKRVASEFEGDRTFLDSVLGIAHDPLAPDPPRLTALMLSRELLRTRRPEHRWFVSNVNWSDGILNDASVGNITFVSGTIQKLIVRRSSLAGVWWGPNVDLVGSLFDDVKFEGVSLEPRNAIHVTFHDAVFRGSTVDVTNFSLVRFDSSPANVDVITPNVGAFEDDVVINRQSPPAANVLDLNRPEKQVRFQRVVFKHVRFEGWIRPEWFQDCSFEECIFPPSFVLKNLITRGNIGIGR